MTLYEVIDLNGNPYTITIDGAVYNLYSDTRNWKASGEDGSNQANFWVYDPINLIDNYFDIFALSISSTPDVVDLSEYGGTPVDGTTDVYEFTLTTTNGEGSITLPDLPYGYHYSAEEQTQNGWKLIDSSYTSGDLTTDKTAAFTNQTVRLTIEKKVAGNGIIGSEPFPFQLTMYAPEGEELDELQAVLDNAGVEYTVNTGDNSLKTTFELTNGERSTFEGLPVGIRFVLSETSHDGYIVKIREIINETEALIVSGDTTETLTLDNDRELVVYNNTGVTLPDAGGIGTAIIYAAGFILLVGAPVLLVVRRRLNRDCRHN